MILDGIVVGADPLASPHKQLSKLQICLTERYNNFKEYVKSQHTMGYSIQSPLPGVFLTLLSFRRGKCYAEAQQLKSTSESSKTACTSLKPTNSGGDGDLNTSDGNVCDALLAPSLSGNKRAMTFPHDGSILCDNVGKPGDYWPRLKSSGTNLNWIADVPYTQVLSQGPKVNKYDATSKKKGTMGGSVEVTIAATGRPQGYVPPKVNEKQQNFTQQQIRQKGASEKSTCESTEESIVMASSVSSGQREGDGQQLKRRPRDSSHRRMESRVCRR